MRKKTEFSNFQNYLIATRELITNISEIYILETY